MEDRRSFLKKTAAGLAYLGLASTIPIDSFAKDDTVVLTILHTNDMHSRIDPFPADAGKFAGLGGMARRAALINQIRQQEEHVLLLDAGDIFQGTPYFNYYGGELEFKLMSEMKYDASTLGNHDFDNGLEGLKDKLPFATFPFLIANYDFSNTILKDQFQPYRIITRGPLKIGVFGLGIELRDLLLERMYGNTRYINPIEVAREMVQELKQKKCDFIICLSHLGYKYSTDKVSDCVLAKEVAGIDLIIGGHTHTFLDEPVKLISPSGEPVWINQVGWGGMKLGRLDYVFSKGKKREMTKTSSLTIR